MYYAVGLLKERCFFVSLERGKDMKERGKHMKRKMKKEYWMILRIVEILIIIFAIMLFTDVMYDCNKQLFQADTGSIFISQLNDKQLSELKSAEINQNIPIPEDVAEKLMNERLKREEQERIKKEAEAKAKKEAEEKAKKEAEAKRLASINKVTTRSSSTPRVTGTKAEYQAYARNLCLNTYGWTENDVQCLIKLWNRESGWNPNAVNKYSGAGGIPQALPMSKMASCGSDYLTNYKTQIKWGLKYIKNRYGNPSKAWQHFQSRNWY